MTILWVEWVFCKLFMKILSDFSPNHSKKARLPKDIKFIIIHYTGMQSEIESIRRLKDRKFKVSCHYLINRKGVITQMVEDSKIAWHAGKSKWKQFVNLNDVSLGIELVNKGHQFGYQKFSDKQLKSLIKLCKKLKNKYAIKKENFSVTRIYLPLEKLIREKISLEKIERTQYWAMVYPK